MKQLTGETPRWIWLVIEENYPYSIGTYRLSPVDLAIGNFEFDRLMDVYKIGMKTGEWGGYTNKIVEAQLPGWYTYQYEEILRDQL